MRLAPLIRFGGVLTVITPIFTSSTACSRACGLSSCPSPYSLLWSWLPLPLFFLLGFFTSSPEELEADAWRLLSDLSQLVSCRPGMSEKPLSRTLPRAGSQQMQTASFACSIVLPTFPVHLTYAASHKFWFHRRAP